MLDNLNTENISEIRQPELSQPELYQTERGIRINIDRSRDSKLTEFGKETLSDRYLMPGEGYQDLFARVTSHYDDDSAHAQRLYD